MANQNSLKDTSISKQMPLLDNGLEAGSFDIVLGAKQTLSRDLKGLDRYFVAAQISNSISNSRASL